ncbi:MAG: M24 family metallopeptidase [Halobacteriales archaeon]
MPTAFERRTRRCQERLDGEGLVLFPGPNLHYLTGVDAEPTERHLLFVLPPEGEPTMIVPELEADRIVEATWVEDVRSYGDEDDPSRLTADALREGALGERVLVDDRLWAVFLRDVRAALPDAEVGLASEVVADLRIRKDDRELAALREAAGIADTVAAAVRDLGADAVGRTERDLAAWIDRRMREAGGDAPAFDTIVAGGPNGARPHHDRGDREIAPGDPVVLDFGCYRGAYPSDQTRTVVFGGDPPAGFEAVFDAVRDAQRAAIEAIEPGVTAGAVDRAARAVIEDRGYGDDFLHRTGHGVGLEVHEPPYIVADNDRELEPGMVFSVEPGVYREGAFGVRIEDLVAVTEDGGEVLNGSPRGP